MHSIREKYNKFFTLKNYSFKVIFKTVIVSFILVLILALIHRVFTNNLPIAVIGLTFSFSGAYLLFNWKEIFKNNNNLVEPLKTTPLNQHIYTNGGNNIEKNDGTYIQGDVDNSLKQYINTVENSSDISETLIDFKEKLTETIFQSTDTLKAISGFVEELTELFRSRPDLKSYFNADEYTSEEELVNGIIRILIAQDFTQIESITNSSDLVNIQSFEIDDEIEEEYKKSKKYREYTIGLLNVNNKWKYRIQRKDNSFLDNPSRQKSYSEQKAIEKAQKEIDKELNEQFDKQESIE